MSDTVHEERDVLQQELAKGDALSVIDLIDALILHAALTRASDIHLDPTDGALRVRMRIDGLIVATHSMPARIHSEVIARLKILAGLRSDEHYAAQDGRFRITGPNRVAIDIRIAIAPTFYGENAVLRLLPEERDHDSLDSLGFSPEHLTLIREALAHRTGMILVTGPTGSGKTTTLYALMESLSKEFLSLITIEDPIEYSINNVTQIPANARTGLTFAQGLRSILRQDPDVIMVGEIRDEETASLAINAALTGHLVLSSLHTSNAASVFPRLADLHVPPFLAASTVRLIIAQRLVRRACEACSGNGTHCTACSGSGYRGRLGIYELIAVSEKIEEAVLARKSARDIARVAHSAGMHALHHDAKEKAAQGFTTIEEIDRLQYA